MAVFSGVIASEDTSRVKPEGVVIFAIDDEAPFNPLEPGSFIGIEPLGIGAALNLSLASEGLYSVGRLVEAQALLVVGVLDTNNDGVYDPVSDWWGYYGDEFTGEPLVVEASEHPQSVNSQVDFTLRPPR